jgi:hypothetical protein
MPLDALELDLTTAQAVVAPADPGLRVEQVVRLTGGILSSVFEVRAADA